MPVCTVAASAETRQCLQTWPHTGLALKTAPGTYTLLLSKLPNSSGLHATYKPMPKMAARLPPEEEKFPWSITSSEAAPHSLKGNGMEHTQPAVQVSLSAPRRTAKNKSMKDIFLMGPGFEPCYKNVEETNVVHGVAAHFLMQRLSSYSPHLK